MEGDCHQSYFNAADPAVLERLLAIQREVDARVPGAEHCISYGMPAFRDGRIFLYFAAFRKHIGIFPPVRDNPELLERLQPFVGQKGNLKLPHTAPLPIQLIGEVAQVLARQYAGTRYA